MMNQFYKVLTSRGHSRHNGQALWKYNLTDDEYLQLRKGLTELRGLGGIDPRDCTLYYAEWWKRSYNGGIPSKKEIYHSIENGQHFDEEDLYQTAKRGAELLGINWIRRQNTLYFKTLLLQGGLPIKHLANHKGAYISFLVKILELNPQSIDDFAFDSTYTSILPASSRNDEIYECCFHIVKAIMNDDVDYLSLLDENEELQEISKTLRIKKKSINASNKKSKIKSSWVFEPEKRKIRLYLGIPDHLDHEYFHDHFLINNTADKECYEYKLFINDTILCKFVKKVNNQFRTIWINQSDILWDGTDQFPNLSVYSIDGHQFECQHLISYLPTLHRPTLWSKYSENQWLLERGNNTSQNEASVLFPSTFQPPEGTPIQDIELYTQQVYWTTFTENIIFSKESEPIIFKTNSKAFVWFIQENKPSWMAKANFPVVRNKPKIFVYDLQDNLIKNPIIKWREERDKTWNSWEDYLPKGLVEIQIRTEDAVEHDYLYNIEYLELEIVESNLDKAKLLLKNNHFKCRINEIASLNIVHSDPNSLILTRTNTTLIPKAIPFSIRHPLQSKSLRFEITPPFKGVEIIDKNEKIIPNKSIFNLKNLNGYRLLCNEAKVVINIFNNCRTDIIFTEQIIEKSLPIRIFEDKILQLFNLTDLNDDKSEVSFEISIERHGRISKQREFKIKKYNTNIEWHLSEEPDFLEINEPKDIELFAIPTECTNELVDLIAPQKENGRYLLKNQNSLNNFLVFCSRESHFIARPAHISFLASNETPSYIDQINKSYSLHEQMLSASKDDEIWKRLLSYYEVCRNHNLPYSTFDILKGIAFSSKLAARVFVYLLCYESSQTFLEEESATMEQDLGFAFHWINKQDWESAMVWVDCFTNPELLILVSSSIKSHFDSLYPAAQFGNIFNYVFQATTPPLPKDYHLNSKIATMRETLGSGVLSQLPNQGPKIPDNYKCVLPVTNENANVKILLKSPLSVALSISGLNDSLWKKEYINIRRNVRYCQQLNPIWYSEAVNYCLHKLQNIQ